MLRSVQQRMGIVFGKETVAEPSFEVILESSSQLPYQLRRYGERFVAQAEYTDETNTPFRTLAKYIGVFGEPENKGSEKMAMTAPVIMEAEKKGTPIAMTAPVMMQKTDQKRVMGFVLPAEYNSMDKIPQPNDPRVQIKSIPPQVGAVHRFNGSMNTEKSKNIALQLAAQLRADGLSEVTDEQVLQSYQFWGYNPPFTIPFFRRNEVWIGLDDQQTKQIMQHFQEKEGTALPN